ncbi:DUF1573 domain-containing protein [Vampirovibrio chlorellavorus]|uniref:DUF1573 domain-containing protein n=1 Tax=Vampirovibrio chlorellavorus TaxID=758823 RepID=UPI0026EE2094|nr:DUF1573 domain-containing protein [Vampirovibrio chlorellavorus]
MRFPLRKLIFLILLTFAGISMWLIFTTPGRKPVVISVYEPPIIKAEQRIEEVGKVETDSKVPAHFLLYNVGGKPLKIVDVQTSCGCTVAKLSKTVVYPGDFTRLDVSLDTSIKLGKVRKQITVKSNDPKRPTLPLFLVGEVLPKKMASHAPITVQATDRLVLFKGECATCHVQAGKGKTGKALFVADCAMCHGINGQGHLSAGPSLLTGNYEDAAYQARMRKIIAEGSAQSPQMPPFSNQHGGPLSNDEIDSLVAFLKVQTMKQRMGLLTQPAADEAEDQAAFEEALRQPH